MKILKPYTNIYGGFYLQKIPPIGESTDPSDIPQVFGLADILRFLQGVISARAE